MINYFKDVSKNIEIMVRDVYRQGYTDGLEDSNINKVIKEKQRCDNCRNNEGEPNPFDTCHSCHDGSEYEGKKTARESSTQEKLMEILRLLENENERLHDESEQYKGDKLTIPGHCKDCKHFSCITINSSVTESQIAFCGKWNIGIYNDNGSKCLPETIPNGYCHMFEPAIDKKVNTTGTWTQGICDNCGYDWGKDAPTAIVPEYCPKCGQRKL